MHSLIISVFNNSLLSDSVQCLNPSVVRGYGNSARGAGSKYMLIYFRNSSHNSATS